MLALRLIRPHSPSDVRLQKILENIAEHLQPCRPLDGVLRALDASKRALFSCLRDHFDSPLVAKALTLKIQNLCLAQYHFRARSTRVLAAPFGLIVDPANGCGLACPGCVHSARSRKLELFTWEKGMLSGDLLAALLNRCGPWSLQVVFCNYGEPLLNPATPQYIRLAKSWLMGTALSSSLSVRHFDAEEYVRSGLDLLHRVDRWSHAGSLRTLSQEWESLARV